MASMRGMKPTVTLGMKSASPVSMRATAVDSSVTMVMVTFLMAGAPPQYSSLLVSTTLAPDTELTNL